MGGTAGAWSQEHPVDGPRHSGRVLVGRPTARVRARRVPRWA
jgi:hypothetical protein